MATKGSYLFYSDTVSGAAITGITEYTTGSSFDVSVLSGTSTNYFDLDYLLTLELNYWVLDDDNEYEYYDGSVGFLTSKYTCESRYKPTEFIDSDSAVILTDEDGVSLADELEQLLADSDAVAKDVGFIGLSEVYSSSTGYWEAIESLTGLTINWAGDSTPQTVTIRYYDSDSEVIAEETFTNSENNYYTLSGENVSYIQISVNDMTLPYRMLKINSVGLGREVTLTGKTIRSAKIVNEMSLDSETLPASTLSFTFEATDGEVPFVYGGGIEAYGKALSGDVILIGTYYIDTITRKTKTQYTIEAIDAVGMIDKRASDFSFQNYMVCYFNYSGSNTYEIYLPDMFMSGYDVDVSEAPSRGVGTALISSASSTDRTYRDWIRDFCFTLDTRCSTDGRSGFRMFALDTDTGNAVVIDDSRVYQGNSIDEVEAVDTAGCYGYWITGTSGGDSYYASTSTLSIWGTTLYCYKSYITYTIDADGNEVFTHATSDTTSTADVSASDCLTVLAVANIGTSTYSETGVRDGDCAIRLYNFYQRTKTAKCKIVWDGERLGDLVTVPDPYGDTLTGHIQKMTFTLSNITAAEIEVLGLAGQ